MHLQIQIMQSQITVLANIIRYPWVGSQSVQQLPAHFKAKKIVIFTEQTQLEWDLIIHP